MAVPVSSLPMACSGDPMPGAASDVPTYRIPSLVCTGSGRLVLAYDVREGPQDLPGRNGIALRHSDDWGESWSPPRWLLRHDQGEFAGCGDPSLITSGDGTLLCWYVASAGISFWDDAVPGRNWWLRLARSEDEGAHWEHEDLTCRVFPQEAANVFVTSGNGIELTSGRLVQPLVVRVPGVPERHTRMALSDDAGASWFLGEPVPGCDETKVVEHAGAVVLHGRATPHRKLALSHDGARTFSAPVDDVPDPGCNGGLVALPQGRLACTLPFPGGTSERRVLTDPTGGRGLDSGPDWNGRQNLVLRVGTPGDWGAPRVIDPGAAAYSAAAALPDGTLAVVWEYGDYEGLAFARLRV